MPSVFMLRALLGASLGLGTLDLVWINAVLAPQLEPAARPGAEASAATTASIAEVVVPSVPASGAPRAADASVVSRRVYFATRSTKLEEPARVELARLVAEADPRAELELEGHADYRGGEAFNLSLSKARALAVQAELVRLGMSPARIQVSFAGEEASGGRDLWRDRRVDLHLRGAR